MYTVHLNTAAARLLFKRTLYVIAAKPIIEKMQSCDSILNGINHRNLISRSFRGVVFRHVRYAPQKARERVGGPRSNQILACRRASLSNASNPRIGVYVACGGHFRPSRSKYVIAKYSMNTQRGVHVNT